MTTPTKAAAEQGEKRYYNKYQFVGDNTNKGKIRCFVLDRNIGLLVTTPTKAAAEQGEKAVLQ